MTAPVNRPPTMADRDVDLDVLLADPEAARRFVTRYLEPLGDDDPRMAEQ